MYTTESEEVQDLSLAKDIAETLHSSYPGHLWAVNVTGGVVQIKNLYISDKYGMVIHYNNIKGDAGHRKKRVINAAGEFLERAYMKRGAYTGEAVKKVDGIRR
jgi:hypothetical protein